MSGENRTGFTVAKEKNVKSNRGLSGRKGFRKVGDEY